MRYGTRTMWALITAIFLSFALARSADAKLVTVFGDAGPGNLQSALITYAMGELITVCATSCVTLSDGGP